MRLTQSDRSAQHIHYVYWETYPHPGQQDYCGIKMALAAIKEEACIWVGCLLTHVLKRAIKVVYQKSGSP